MRWVGSNWICRFIYRHFPAFVLLSILLLSANQVIHFAKDKSSQSSPICYKIFAKYKNPNSNSTVPKGYVVFNNDTGGEGILPNIEWSRSRSDDRRMLKIYDWIWPAGEWASLVGNRNVCLATQGSLDRISSIGEVAEAWGGPISLAVYVRNAEELWILSLFVGYMRRCSGAFATSVSVHLVVPSTFQKPDYGNASYYFDSLEEGGVGPPCGDPTGFMTSVLEKLREGGHPEAPLLLLYPQNHMRNIARKNCPTPWVFMTDVDIIPRPNASAMLTTFYNSIHTACQKCAWVIPVFELDRSKTYPKSKRELVSYVEKGSARQFHLKIYRYGHWATNYSAWLSTNVEEGPEVKVSHPVDNKANHYEPFYVSSDDVPKHDERFIGYGFTRSSQLIAKYNISVSRRKAQRKQLQH